MNSEEIVKALEQVIEMYNFLNSEADKEKLLKASAETFIKLFQKGKEL